MSSKLNIFIILLTSLLVLSGCSGDRCIDPDDFGFIKATISSRYAAKDLTERQKGDQSAPWLDSNYRVNGYPLTIVVRPWNLQTGDKNNSQELSAWCPWYGQEDNASTLSRFCVRLQDCQFLDGNMCTSGKDAKITNPPCLFRNGIGLYFLIADRGSDPNMSPDTQRAPRGITRHMGESVSGYQFYSINKKGDLVPSGGVNYQFADSDKSQYSQCPLYFKILDKFYDDNNGQYKVVIKSGVSDTRPDPLEFLTNLIKKELFGSDDKDPGIVRKVYENIINTPGYRLSVSAFLTLYIMFTGFSFLIGNLNLTHVELVKRVLKVSIVSILLSSTNSWQFFHDYLFVYFIEGVEQILQIIKEASASGPGSQSLLGLMIAPQTLSKLFSLLFVDPLGFIYIILYLIALYFIFFLIFKATIIYLTALITVGMIITMGPIFICFMLFNITRSLFENWLRQLISYTLQPIILFAGIAFISMIIRTEIYSTLGFGVCKHDFPNLGPIGEIFGDFTESLDVSLGNSIFYFWFPTPMKGGQSNFHKANILVPMDFREDDGSPDGKLCMAYECIDERYIELPFLDLVKDARRISNFINGKFVQLDGILLIFVCIYLLSKFNDVAVSIAKFISSTSGNLTNLQKVGQEAFDPIKRIADKPIDYVANKGSMAMNQLRELSGSKLAGLYEDKMMSRVAREAIDDKSMNPSVLAEVKRNYGIDYNNVNMNAEKDYRTALQNLMPELGKDKVKELSNKNYRQLQDSLAEIKFNAKDYKSLDAAQKAELDNLAKSLPGDKSLRELASDANFTRQYQDAYKDSHQAMSARGLGVIGKNVGLFRDFREAKNRVDEKRRLRDEKRTAIGEKIYAGYAGLKRGALTAVTGEKLRDAFEGNLTEAAWHDFNYEDPQLRTYSESLEDKAREREYRELRLKADKETLSSGEDITSPEYLARLKKQGRVGDIEYYQEISRKKLEFEVRSRLADGEEPAIMGDRFMREKATDSQMKNMIDKTYKLQEDFINEDRYVRREEHYDIMREKAENNITKTHAILKEHYGRNDIRAEEMPVLLEQYHRAKGDDADIIAKEVSNLNNNLTSFDYSGDVLTKIEEKKADIRNEFNAHVEEVNQYREKAKMPKYIKPVVNEGRKLRSIEEHLRG